MVTAFGLLNRLARVPGGVIATINEQPFVATTIVWKNCTELYTDSLIVRFLRFMLL
jgi:hypothetical protein